MIDAQSCKINVDTKNTNFNWYCKVNTFNEQITLEKTEGAIKNEKFIDTDNIWHTGHMTKITKINKKQNKQA